MKRPPCCGAVCGGHCVTGMRGGTWGWCAHGENRVSACHCGKVQTSSPLGEHVVVASPQHSVTSTASKVCELEMPLSVWGLASARAFSAPPAGSLARRKQCMSTWLSFCRGHLGWQLGDEQPLQCFPDKRESALAFRRYNDAFPRAHCSQPKRRAEP